jgi:major curlin subunit
MTTNTIKTTANLLKAGLISVVAAAGFGLLTLPAKADEVNQGTVQTNQQDGYGNTGVNQSTQNANINKRERNIGRTSGADRPSPDKINQNSDQLSDQVGESNTGVNQNTQDASINKDTVNVRPERRVPRH